MMEIVLEGGKYTYRCADNGAQTVHRHGELWRDFTGDKFIYRMAAKIEQLQDENAALKEELELMKREVRMKADENQAIYEQLAAAQKDAERYRWLRADSRPAAWRLEYWVGYWECSTFGDDLDAAIDKELAKCTTS